MKESKLPGITIAGAISGVLSILLLHAAGQNSHIIQVQVAVQFLPGVLFGVALWMASIFPLGRPLLTSRFRGVLKVLMGLVFVALVTVCYFLAYRTVVLVLNKAFHSAEAPTLAFCGLLGGGVGSVTFVGVLAMYFPSMANRTSAVRVVLAGTTAGLLLFGGAKFGWLGIYFFILAWQIVVALIIGVADVSSEADPRLRRRHGRRR
ncbi:MAG: hypothetical protein AAF591_08985 [Verrucomicrobiota bacterium]